VIGPKILTKRHATERGGMAKAEFGVRVFVSDQLPGPVHMLVVDGDQVAADPGRIEFDSSRQSDIVMQSESSDQGSELLSLFQTGGLALKAERTFAFRLLRSTGASVVIQNESI
jgi:hypothetical protein